MVTDTEITEKLKEHREAKKATDTMVDSEDLKLLQKLQSDMDNLVVAFASNSKESNYSSRNTIRECFG